MPRLSKEDFRKASPKFKLVPHLDKAIQEFDEEWEFKYEPKKGDFAFHPSGWCVPDPSTLYHSALDKLEGVEEKQKSGMRKYGPVGHFWHQWLQLLVVEKLGFAEPSAIERIGITGWDVSDFNQPYLPYHYATGAADVAPCNIPGYGAYLVDFKTMSGQQFRQMALPEFFARKYECQMNVYMNWFNLDKALIFCINKDTPHDFKEIEYRRDQKLIDAIYNKWKFVSDCLDNGYIPTEKEDKAFKLPFDNVK